MDKDKLSVSINGFSMKTLLKVFNKNLSDINKDNLDITIYFDPAGIQENKNANISI